MSATQMERLKRGPGRPRKYSRPSRVVSVTLPEDVLASLGAVDVDLGRAIVTLAERKGLPRVTPVRHAELAAYGSHAVIVVTPAKALKRIAGVQLVPIGNGRALISLKGTGSIPQFELGLGDALEQANVGPSERLTLEAIAEILRKTRRSRSVTLEERTIIVLEGKRRRRHS